MKSNLKALNFLVMLRASVFNVASKTLLGSVLFGAGSLMIGIPLFVFRARKDGKTNTDDSDGDGGLVRFVAIGSAIGAAVGCVYGIARVLGAFAAAAAISSAALSLAGALGGGEHLHVAAAAISTAAFWWAM